LVLILLNLRIRRTNGKLDDETERNQDRNLKNDQTRRGDTGRGKLVERRVQDRLVGEEARGTEEHRKVRRGKNRIWVSDMICFRDDRLIRVEIEVLEG